MKRWIMRRNNRDKKNKDFEKGFGGEKRGKTFEIAGKMLFWGYLKPYQQKPARTKPKEPNKSKC